MLREFIAKLVWREGDGCPHKTIDMHDMFFATEMRNRAVVAVIAEVLGSDESKWGKWLEGSEGNRIFRIFLYFDLICILFNQLLRSRLTVQRFILGVFKVLWFIEGAV